MGCLQKIGNGNRQEKRVTCFRLKPYPFALRKRCYAE
ncbi:hypothetical protein MED222_05465 [Vibrio sp. MED222]|nr:hypothetical protein MED222_05465 [Vibrio sp. MED222]